MRLPLLPVALLLAACAPHPPPSPSMPAPAPAAPSTDAAARPASWPGPGPCGPETSCFYVCVVRGGRLEEVAFYGMATDDSTYRQRYSAEFPTDSTYAGNAPWLRDREPLALLGDLYVMYGLPRILGIIDVVPIATFRGVTVFAEPNVDPTRPEVIYIPLRPGCEFQPYKRHGSKE